MDFSRDSITHHLHHVQKRGLRRVAGLDTNENGDESDEVDRHFDDKFYGLLTKTNKSKKPEETLRLPSDILHRRRSRFDSEENVLAFFSQDSDSREATVNQIAQVVRYWNVEGPTDKASRLIGVKRAIKESYSDLTLFKSSLNRIHGKCGSAVAEFFSFVKWLIKFNLFITLLSLILIIPQIRVETSQNVREYTQHLSSSSCNESYRETLKAENAKKNLTDKLIDIILGTGVLEDLPAFFYGSYSSETYTINGSYRMPLAFLMVLFVTFICSIALLFYEITDKLRREFVSSSKYSKNKYCSAILTGWDYGLSNNQAVKTNFNLVSTKLQRLVEVAKHKDIKNQRTRMERIAIRVLRVAVNTVVLAILVGCGVAIYLIQQESQKAVESLESSEDQARLLFFEYLPSGLITAIYMIIPTLLSKIVKLEYYKPEVEINVTLIRVLLLRLLTLSFHMIFNVIQPVLNSNFNKLRNTTMHDCSQNKALCQCWETYTGQQIYKLVVLDFAVLFLTTFGEYIRQAAHKKFQEKKVISKVITQQEFDMPKNVMDVAYNQTLCWIGIFFSPIIPAIIFVKMCIFFWLKKSSLMRNQKASSKLSKSSDIYSFFLLVMLISLAFAYITVTTCISFIKPSECCGPSLPNSTSILDNLYYETQEWEIIQHIFFYLQQPYSIALIVITLIMIWYYYTALNHGLSMKINIYTSQLASVIKDKQYYYKTVNGMSEKRQSTAETNNNNLRRSVASGQINNNMLEPAASEPVNNIQINAVNASMQSTGMINGDFANIKGKSKANGWIKRNGSLSEHKTERQSAAMQRYEDIELEDFEYEGHNSNWILLNRNTEQSGANLSYYIPLTDYDDPESPESSSGYTNSGYIE